MPDDLSWWQRGPIYQLIVRSFLDSNGDGEGDLPGLIRKLDYIEDLGAEALWLSPVHPSPMRDLGYDVSDYRDIHPLFGSMDDFDTLLREAHDRDIKIVMDWVPNHTSDQHPWFQESRSSRDNPRRDWYVWRDPKPDGSPPNNWISVFGGSMWEWDEQTQQYYLHTFLEAQPDLNWHNPDVQEAMFDTLRFWLERGVDGFRVDATCLIAKDPQYRDNPPNPDFEAGQPPDNKLIDRYTRDQPQVHELLARARRIVDEYDERMLSGELYLSTEQAVTYYGGDEPELHLPFNLQLCWTDWDAGEVGRTIDHYMEKLPDDGWPTWTISTHDSQRIAGRAEGEQARVAALLQLTLPGALTLYYGQEIGMRGTSIPPEQRQDPQGKRIDRSRDEARTPMQWDDSEHAGFTTGTPWLPVADDYDTVNVAAQQDDERSLLTLYRRLLALRREEPALVTGTYRSVETEPPLLAYLRPEGERKLLVVLNFSSEPQSFELPTDFPDGRVMLSTFLDRPDEDVQDVVDLRGDEGVLLAL